MILTKRQYDILKHLIKHHDTFISTEMLATLFDVSSRTVKNELPFIKKYICNFHSFNLETLPGKGIRIHVLNMDSFMNEIVVISKHDIATSDVDNMERDISILKYFIDHTGYIVKEKIMSTFYISESTFYKTYNNIKGILAPFSLTMKHSKSKGYHISGHEKDIRSLIAKYELIDRHRHVISNFNNISYVYNFVADVFIHYQYKMTEPILQNISSHVVLMEYRIKSGNTLDTLDYGDLHNRIEYQIAHTICEKFIQSYHLNKQHFENEVLLLTQTILGKTNYSTDEKTQNEINDFINYAFKCIHAKFGINFVPVEKLRLFLGLHLVPLIYRIKSGTQLKNLMETEIRQQFPHATDISLYFSLLFKECLHLTISGDELAYITLYFNFGIEELNLAKSSKRLLVITKLRASETVLLRHKLLSWFPNQIMDITFINPSEDSEDLEQYDAVFATELYSKNYNNAVTLINIFPNETDFKKINLALNGYTNAESILEKFHSQCFFFGQVENKEEIISILCDKAHQTYNLNHDFFDNIWSRESIASTYFGDLVALPHPLAPLSDETFVSVGILDKPIHWDGEYFAQFVMLISIEKNNPKAFQFWHYMSDIIRNNDSLKELMKQKSYDKFIASMERILLDILDN